MNTRTQEEQRLAENLAAYPADVRAALLRHLTKPADVRAAQIGELHDLGAGITELLIDLEEDDMLRLTVVQLLVT